MTMTRDEWRRRAPGRARQARGDELARLRAAVEPIPIVQLPHWLGNAAAKVMVWSAPCPPATGLEDVAMCLSSARDSAMPLVLACEAWLAGGEPVPGVTEDAARALVDLFPAAGPYESSDQLSAVSRQRDSDADSRELMADGPSGGAAPADAVVIEGVDPHKYWRGCLPTQAGQAAGYWAENGHANLQPGTWTAMVASADHIEHYYRPVDNRAKILKDGSETGVDHPANCIADHGHTSWSFDNNPANWSRWSKADDCLREYARACDYADADAWNESWSGADRMWQNITDAVSAGFPVGVLGDSDGDGRTDHFWLVIGYGTIGGVRYIGCLNTWDTSLHWYRFRRIGEGAWGIYGATFFDPGTPDEEEEDMATISGKIMRADGSDVPGVQFEFLGREVVSDDHGQFVMADLSGGVSLDVTLPLEGPQPATVVVDTEEAVFSPGWKPGCVYRPGYYGTDYRHDYNKNKGKMAVFEAALPEPGTYAVEMWWPVAPIWASNVPVIVCALDGDDTLLVDEDEAGGGMWNRLGTYPFGATAKVVIGTVNTTHHVAADAVRFVRVEVPQA